MMNVERVERLVEVLTEEMTTLANRVCELEAQVGDVISDLCMVESLIERHDETISSAVQPPDLVPVLKHLTDRLDALEGKQ